MSAHREPAVRGLPAPARTVAPGPALAPVLIDRSGSTVSHSRSARTASFPFEPAAQDARAQTKRPRLGGLTPIRSQKLWRHPVGAPTQPAPDRGQIQPEWMA